MLVIRLRRVGKKKAPFFRLVVTQKTAPPQGKFIEILGNYNPKSTDKKIEIKKERVKFWIDNGAQPSDTVNNLLCKIGFLPKSAIIKRTTTKKKKKKEKAKVEKPEHIETPKKTEAEAGGLLEKAEKEMEEETKEKAEGKEEKTEEVERSKIPTDIEKEKPAQEELSKQKKEQSPEKEKESKK